MTVIPVYNMILAPDATLYLQTEQIKICSAGEAPTIGETVILIIAKENTSYQDLNEDSFYPIGVLASITGLDERGFATVRTEHRVNLEKVWVNADHAITLSISQREEIDDLDHELEAEKLKNLLRELRTYSSGFQWAEMAYYFIV